MARFFGFYNTTTGTLRSPTDEEINRFIEDFKGKEVLEEPFSIVEAE